jgi:purine-binding chemotaxis protein CheW
MGSIMQERQHTEATDSEEGQSQYLTFQLSGEMYAIPILNIKEIIEYGQLTTVPMMPAFIRGVINLRGSVVPVIDLAVRFGRKSGDVSRRTCIVIIEIMSNDEKQDAEKQDIGVVVDSVNEVLEIPNSEIEKTPSFGARIRADFIQGMGKINGKFVIILAVNQVLSIDEMAMLGQAGSVQPEAIEHG